MSVADLKRCRSDSRYSVDPELKARLERELNELQLELAMYTEEGEKLMQRWTQLQSDDAEFASRSVWHLRLTVT